MDQRKRFFVTLPSNGSDLTSAFGLENNTQTDFYTDLKESLDFSNNYEVALVEYSYRKNWLIDYGKIIIYKWIGIYREHHKTITISLHDGISLIEIIDEIRKKIKKKHFDIIYEDNFVKISVPDDIDVEFNGYIASRLNLNYQVTKSYNSISNDKLQIFSEKNIISDSSDHFYITGKQGHIVQSSIKSKILKFIEEIFVYTDVIKSVHVGQDMRKLLKIITDNNNYDTVVTETINNPHYIPLESRHISRIRLFMRDSKGNKIRFSDPHSRVVNKLHFRQSNQL